MKERQQQILDLVKEFCTQKLNDGYAELSEKMVQKLGRKRPPPIATGQPEIWAAAIIHAIGSVNFLFDQSFEPYATLDDINSFFGTKKSTTGNKARQIRDMFKLDRWDNEFSTRGMRDSNPLSNFVMVDGLIVPVDSLPEEYQEMVRQARAEGKDISFRTG